MSPVEAIIVMHKGDWKKHAGGISTISKEEFTKWTIGVWDFNAEKTKIGHPAPFPVDLPERCIKLFSYADDVILDPFVGSGTTLIACLRTGRAGIGVEIDEKYCEVAKNRIMKEIGV
jgi:site-specific DNA-methyltransferase (adenine-specific)